MTTCTEQCNRKATGADGLCDWHRESNVSFAETLALQAEFRSEIRAGKRKPLRRSHFAVMCQRGYEAEQARLAANKQATPAGDGK